MSYIYGMEKQYYYRIKYNGKVLHPTILAHSYWEAIDRFYNDHIEDYPGIERKLITAHKLK